MVVNTNMKKGEVVQTEVGEPDVIEVNIKY
jgi:hypothetical protein